MDSGDSETKTAEAGASRLLDSINSPRDLKALSIARLGELAQEIRERIIATAAANGGHLAPHLGVVELTLALHYVFDTERDKLIWDVGHQCYAHKLVTGRREKFDSIRKKGGLAGYPRRDESPYDAFGVGHSSTSISAGLGMAVARDRNGEDYRVIAVIGDGAMTGGQAFEALAHAGHLGTDLLVVLNDNNMSISPNVGALSAYFSRLITGGLYNRAHADFHGVMERMLGATVKKAAQRIESSVKGMITPGTMFEELGFKYVGPVDGHDLETLVDCLSNLKRLHAPVFFHCVTQKGKGYPYAEKDPQTYHGVKAFDIETGEFRTPEPSAGSAKSFTDAFAESLVALAREDERIVAITAAMATGTGLSKLDKEVPGRVFDVGICEQHAVTFSAGLATQGLRPVCAIYSTFLQRGFDQCVHDVCLQNLPVVFAIDRAGAVGEDSPTQQGAFDLSFLRPIPNLTILTPRDDVDTAAMLRWALAHNGPVAFRYARGKAPTIGGTSRPEDVRHGQILREGTGATLLAVGPVLSACLKAAEMLEKEGFSIRVADARCVKPLDEALMARIEDAPILTVEENTVVGGFGAAVLEYFERKNRLHKAQVRMLGFPDAFIDHATRDEQLADMGLDAEGIAREARVLLQQRVGETAR